jgi:hypothetical protein
MTVVALKWKWSGVSWSGLAPLFGLVFAVTLCAAYGLFRLTAGPAVSALAVLPLAISAHQLAYLPHLRDYAKAPFILFLLLIVVRLALPPYSRRRSLCLAATFGALLGVGLGFRNDLLITVPPFVGVVLLLLPVRWRDELATKAACLGLACITFVVCAWPILGAYRSGSNTGHVAVLGLVSSFDGPLGVTRPAYDLGSHYLDGYAAAVINAHHVLHHGRHVEYLSPGYDVAALALIADVAKHWPADMFVRALASVLRILEQPFTIGQYDPAIPIGVTAPWILRLYAVQADVLRALSGLGPWLVTAAVVVIGSAAPRAGIALALVILYYCGYPAFQFDIRHFFHLELIGWWALVFVGAVATRAIWRFVSSGTRPRVQRRAVVGALVTASAILALTAPPLWALRTFQQRHLVRLFDEYVHAHRTPLAVTRTTASGLTRVSIDGLWTDRTTSDPIAVRYLLAEFTSEPCEAVDVPVTAAYEVRTGANDFSTVARLPIDSSGSSLLLMPVYYNGDWSHFVGFDLPEGYDTCLTSVSAIDELSRIPVPVELALGPRWRSSDLFQRLANWEAEPRPDATRPLVRVQPADLVVPRESRLVRETQLSADYMMSGITPDGAGGVRGAVKLVFPQQTLVHFPPRSIDGGLVLRATGVLRRGGLQIGVLQNEHVIDSRAVTSAGPFIALIQERDPGSFGARVSDFSVMDWRWEPASLLREVAWLVAPWMRAVDFDLHALEWIRLR